MDNSKRKRSKPAGIKPVEIYLIQLFAGLTKYRVDIFIISASFGSFEILSLYSQNVF